MESDTNLTMKLVWHNSRMFLMTLCNSRQETITHLIYPWDHDPIHYKAWKIFAVHSLHVKRLC